MAAQTKGKCEKFRMLQRVVYKVIEEQSSSEKVRNLNTLYLERAMKYTGLQRNVLAELKHLNSFSVPTQDIDRLTIYFELVNFYLKHNNIPTTWKLFNSLYKKIPPYVDIGTFRKMLVKMDFIWKSSSYGFTYVIERPEVVIERYHYLKQIFQHRREDKDIYFVNEFAIVAATGFVSLEQSNRLAKKVPTVNQQRVIQAVSKNGVHCVKLITSFDAETFENWIIEDLLPSLPNSSVVVYNNSKHHCRKVVEIPTQDSLKIEMTKWLQLNGVPFNSEMSKYELYSLIETCTNINENMYKIDVIIEAFKHRVLRTPNCIKNVTPANLLNQIISKNAKRFIFNDTNKWHDDVLDKFNELIECIPAGTFFTLYDTVMKQEQVIFNTDKSVDTVIDDLLNKINSVGLNIDNDSDIPSCSESD